MFEFSKSPTAKRKEQTANFPRSAGEMNLPKSSALDYDSDGSQDKPQLRIIKIEKKKNVGDVDISKFKKKKATNWKTKKDNLKRMVNLDLLVNDKKKRTVYDQNRIVPREIHVQDNTDDELFLALESASESTIDTQVSTRSKLESKLKDTKDKYMKYQAKAINKIKSFIPNKSKSNDQLNSSSQFKSKFVTASDLSKSRTLVAEDNRNKIKLKPPRPPQPKEHQLKTRNLLSLPSSKPPARPARKKSKKSLTNLTFASSNKSGCNNNSNLPASVYYRQLREKWLERYASASKSNLSSICSSSIANFDGERKLSFLTNQSLLNDDFRYRYRADYQSNLQLENATERQSIKSEPTYAIGKLESFYICLFILFLFYFITHFHF